MLAQDTGSDATPSELDDGPRQARGRAKPALERTCIVTRKAQPVDALIRFVIGPDGALVPDLKKSLPGRGAWVTGTRAILSEAVKRNAFSRAFGKPVKADGELVVLTERLLERAALDALAMAGKARLVVAGFAKVETALARHSVKALIHASDAARDGVRKLESAVRAQLGDEITLPAIVSFASAQLDLALGRPNVVHAALLAGPAGQTFLARCSRLDRFRTDDPATRGIEPRTAGRVRTRI
jgi:predicted RNA-binding protein YlxR (DUF448 family)